jgi:hypothetical protein
MGWKLQSPLPSFIWFACCSVPSQPGSFRRASQPNPIGYPPAANDEIKHDGFRKTARECGSTAVLAMTSVVASR